MSIWLCEWHFPKKSDIVLFRCCWCSFSRFRSTRRVARDLLRQVGRQTQRERSLPWKTNPTWQLKRMIECNVCYWRLRMRYEISVTLWRVQACLRNWWAALMEFSSTYRRKKAPLTASNWQLAAFGQVLIVLNNKVDFSIESKLLYN